MITHRSEAIVLRTWPFQESDLLVSLFTRDMGRVRGVARAAMKSRRRFGGALEPMTVVRAAYAEKPRQELVRLEHFEAVSSPLARPVDYVRAATLGFYAEVLENVLPDHDPHDAIFRLTLAVLDQTRPGACWMPLTYFALWTTRLIGWMPEIDRCAECGQPLADEGGCFHPLTDGLYCVRHQRLGGGRLNPDTLALASRMLREPISMLTREGPSMDPFAGNPSANGPWDPQAGRNLRRFLVRSLERHLERRLNSAATLARLGG